MSSNNTGAVQHRRVRLRTPGLRQVRLSLPDTRTPAFAAQVAHDIAALAELSVEDEAMLDDFARIAEELTECPEFPRR